MKTALIVTLSLCAAAAARADADPIDELLKLAEEPPAPVKVATSSTAPVEISDAQKHAIVLLTLGAGPGQLRFTATPDTRAWGGFITGEMSVDPSGGKTGLGFLILTGMQVSYDQTKSNYLNFDLSTGLALHLRRLSLGVVAGGGVDYTDHSAADDTPLPGALVLPVSVYGQLGARASYAFDFLPITIEAMATKQLRLTDRAPEEKRAEVRLLIGGEGTPISFAARYTEFLTVRDALTATFSAEGRNAQLFWLAVGIGF